MEELPPHKWIHSEGTNLTNGVPFRFCGRCRTEEWQDGTIRLMDIKAASKCAANTEEYMEWMKANREKQLPKRSAGEQLAFMGTDGAVWAAEFMRINGYIKDSIAPSAEDFEHTLLAWFANAIESGRTAGYGQGFMHGSVEHGCGDVSCSTQYGGRPEEDTP
jgi:hypothetical protein